MRNKGTPADLERRRHLAVERLLDGYTTEEVADFLNVDARSVRRWFAEFRRHGSVGLAARAIPGRPRKLSRTQEKIVLRWLSENPTEFGFATELWTCERLVQLIAEEWGIALNPHSLARWLRAHGLSRQKPTRVPRERDPEKIARWLREDWPRIKKKRAGSVRTWF